MSKDAHVQQAVIDELKWDPKVDGTHIGVAVSEGIVTLTGHVRSFPEKWAAEEAAMRVKGVKGIAQELVVQLPGDAVVNDEDIAISAVDRIDFDVSLPKRPALQVEVEHGWLTLTGNVDWYYQRAAAENAVRNVAGVRGVTNRIAIKPRVDVPLLSDDIVHALHRSWFFDPKTITVTADGGKVRLTGTVKSMHERQVAAATAWSAPGVTDVDNQLSVA